MPAFMTRSLILCAALAIGAAVAVCAPAEALGGAFSSLAKSAADKTLARGAARARQKRQVAPTLR